MIEWDYHGPGLTIHREMLVPSERLGNPLVLRVVDRLIDIGIYQRSTSVRITEADVVVNYWPRAEHFHFVAACLYRWCRCPLGLRCVECSGREMIYVRRRWPLLELLAVREDVS